MVDAPGIWTGQVTKPYDMQISWHTHTVHELLWGFAGPRTVETAERTWVLPPTTGLWIPAGVWHAGFSGGGVRYYGTWVEPERYPSPWPVATPVSIPPLVRELFFYLEENDLAASERGEMEQMALRHLKPVTDLSIVLVMPTDPRARDVATQIAADPANPRSTEQWAVELGITGRTLDRLFVTDTRMTVARWRTQARVRAAILLLGNGHNVVDVAHHVGYHAPSSFVRAFKQITGTTPRAYATALRAGTEDPSAPAALDAVAS